MTIKIEVLPEPLLEFGAKGSSIDPRMGLGRFGAYSEFNNPEQKIRLGLVCHESEVVAIKSWFKSMERHLPGEEGNAQRFRDFPGLAKVFRCTYEFPDKFVRILKASELEAFTREHPAKRFEGLLEAYSRKIDSLFGDVRPDVIVVALPDEYAELRVINHRLSAKERQVLEHLEREDSAQASLFAPDPEELKRILELKPQAQELLFRNFYRALKARLMQKPNAVPLQIIRQHTYKEEKATQSAATRAWNLAVSLYYKSGNVPWKPQGLPDNCCFVGLSFHHLKRQGGDVLYASVAQAFSTTVLPFIIRGAMVPPSQVRNRHAYLTEEQSSDLIRKVIQSYEDNAGIKPDCIVIHKTSHYQEDEVKGFTSAQELIPKVELVWLAPTGFRLVKRGQEEPWRGTMVSISGRDYYLFTTGFMPSWKEYPGPHIPSPLRFGSPLPTDLKQRAREILMLTKMNWNSSDGVARLPITLSFSRRVGSIMTELADDPSPNPSYRFYM